MRTVLLVLIALFLAAGPCIALAVLLIMPRIRVVLQWQSDQLASLAGAVADLQGSLAKPEDTVLRLRTLQKEVIGVFRQVGAGGAELNALQGFIEDAKKLQAQMLASQRQLPSGGADLDQVKEFQRQISDSQRVAEGTLLHLEGQVATLNFALGISGEPSDIVIGPSDSYEKLDQNWLSIRETAGRQLAGNTIDGHRSRTAVIVTLGQSNMANHGSARYTPKGRVDNFNLYDGQCYHAQDPLLGASGDGGNPCTRLGEKLIDAGLFDRVIIAPIAMGGTVVEQWSEDGMFNRRIPVLIRRLYDAGLEIDFILWQQGEGNAGAGDAYGRQYRKNLLEVVRTFRKYGVNAPFFVALCTRCGPEPHPNAENIRAGQRGSVNPTIGIYLGPDTDSIGTEHRHDLCHFDEVGLDMVASLWLGIISEFCSSVRQKLMITEDRGEGTQAHVVGALEQI